MPSECPLPLGKTKEAKAVANLKVVVEMARSLVFVTKTFCVRVKQRRTT